MFDKSVSNKVLFSLANISRNFVRSLLYKLYCFIVWHQSSWVVGIHPLFIYIACSIKIKFYLKHWQWVLFSSSCFSVCLISIFRYHSTLVCLFIFSYLPHSISWNISVTYIYSCINMTNKKIQGKNLTHCTV